MVATVLACAVALLSSVQGAAAQYGGYGGVPPGVLPPSFKALLTQVHSKANVQERSRG